MLLFEQQKNNTACPAFVVLDLFYIMLPKKGKNKNVKVIVKFSIRIYSSVLNTRGAAY